MEDELLRLRLEHLYLTLKSSPVIFTRTLKIAVHPLYVGHEIR